MQARANASPAAVPVRIRRRRFLHPRHWPTWFGLGLLWMLTKLPYRWQLALGRWLGRLLYRALPRRRHIARTNLRLCFPTLSDTERECLLRRHFESMGIALFELGLTWWASDRRLLPLCHIHGLAHVKQALARGRGVILLGAHFTTLEISGRLLAYHLPVGITHKPPRNALVAAYLERSRRRLFQRVTHTYELRGMIKGLKNNGIAWYAIDQDFGTKHSVFAPFMGVMTSTLTTVARLARMTGAPVLPFFQRRLEGGRGYELVILPPLENFPSGNDVADATVVNRAIEAYVRKAPEQYFWAHRRFKTRPPGEKGVYD